MATSARLVQIQLELGLHQELRARAHTGVVASKRQSRAPRPPRLPMHVGGELAGVDRLPRAGQLRASGRSDRDIRGLAGAPPEAVVLRVHAGVVDRASQFEVGELVVAIVDPVPAVMTVM